MAGTWKAWQRTLQHPARSIGHHARSPVKGQPLHWKGGVANALEHELHWLRLKFARAYCHSTTPGLDLRVSWRVQKGMQLRQAVLAERGTQRAGVCTAPLRGHVVGLWQQLLLLVAA